MPNRMLRDWTGSEKINSISVHAERFFTRLIMKADDYGCFHADPRILKGNLFTLLLDSIREADILRWMAECQKAGLIVVYENSGKSYLQILDFNQRLRQKTLKFPLPSNDSNMLTHDRNVRADDSNMRHEGSRREVEVEEEVEVKNSNVREQALLKMFKNATSGFDDDFLLFESRKFLNKYPNCVVMQAGGLVNSWASRLNKQEQEKWKQQSVTPEISSVIISRDQKAKDFLNQF